MKVLFVIGLSLVPFQIKAADASQTNHEGFQAARQYTGEILDDKASFGGKVVETIEVADYTYVQFSHGQEKLWLAASKTQVKKGDTVSFADAQTMRNFHSKSLKRTFDKIYFVSSLNVKAAAR